MFDKNIQTCSTGWDQECSTLKEYDDVREFYKIIKEGNVYIEQESTEGEKSLVVL